MSSPLSFGLESGEPLTMRQMQQIQVARQLCEDDLLTFARTFFKVLEGQSFIVNDHHRIVCAALMDVFHGRRKNLIINIPPGSSKTLLAVISFMAWGIAHNPWCRFLHLSYAGDLVELNSATTKALIETDEYQAMWPRAVSDDTKAKKRWNVMDGRRKAGGCYAVALGGTITGFRAGHMRPGFQGAILIDDPLKPDDAFSSRLREAASRKLSDTVKSRKANPATPIIIIMQRLHVHDATGYSMGGQFGGEQFDLIKVPAIHDMDGPDERSYWEYKEPLADLKKQKKANRQTFYGQYLQEPLVLGGDVFETEWWKYYRVLPNIRYRCIYADTAMKTKEKSDFSVFQCWGLGADGHAYLLDSIRGKWTAPELKRQAVAFWNKWGNPDSKHITCQGMYIEDTQSGTGLIQQIQEDDLIPVFPLKPGTKDKLERVQDILTRIEAGFVHLPDPEVIPNEWMSPLLAETEAFSRDDSHEHDDQVDVIAYAIRHLLGQPKGFSSESL